MDKNSIVVLGICALVILLLSPLFIKLLAANKKNNEVVNDEYENRKTTEDEYLFITNAPHYCYNVIRSILDEIVNLEIEYETNISISEKNEIMVCLVFLKGNEEIICEFSFSEKFRVKFRDNFSKPYDYISDDLRLAFQEHELIENKDKKDN